MIPRSVRAISALGAIALVQSSAAIDLGHSGMDDGEQCNVSSLYADYQAPKRLVQAQTEVIQGPSLEMLASQMMDRHAWLQASGAEPKRAAFVIDLNRHELEQIGAVEGPGLSLMQADPRRVQVGIDKPVGFDIDFSTLSSKALSARGSDHMRGIVRQGVDGELIWTSVVQSGGATGIRLGFEDVNLPKGAELYVYNDQGQAFGPYTGRGPNDDGTFWSNTVFGEQVKLQLHFYGTRSTDNLLNLGFKLASVVHIGPRFPVADFVDSDKIGTKAHCNYNASCVESGSQSGNAPVSDAKNAVALMVYTSRGGAYICSGGLLADTDSGSVKNYFLTANHCISKGREANSLETFFDFDTSCGDQYAQSGSYPGTNGASIKSTSKTSDYTLLELNQTPGGNRAYLGWDNAPVAFSSGTELHRISHPSGAPQAYSNHSVNTNKGTCSSWPRGNWIYSNDLFGATEGGSSGSPVLNNAGLVVGQLSGGCGTNVGDTCDTQSNSTVDGALAAYWGSVETYLDPAGDPPPPPPGGEATVDSVSVSVRSQGPWNRAVATILIVDGSGNPVANAVVSGSFGGDASGSGSGTTGSNGVTTITSNRTRSNINSPSFCVSTVNGATATGNTCG